MRKKLIALLLVGLSSMPALAATDCAPEPSPETTFSTAAQSALCLAPDVRKARALLDSRAAGAALQAASQLPSANFSGGLQNRHSEAIPGTQSQQDLALQLDWTAWDGGRRQADTAAADALARAAHADLAQVQLDILYQAATSWLTLSQATERIAALEASEALAKELADTARARRDAGLVTKADLLQAEADWFAARHAVSAAKLQVATAESEFNRITGLSGGALASLDSTLVALEPSARAMDAQEAENLISRALGRPGVAAQAQRVEASAQSVEAARKAYSPSVTLSARVSATGEPGELSSSQSLMATLNVPLYTGGARDAKSRAALAEREMQASAQADLQMRTRSQTQTAHGRLHQSKLAIESAQAGLAAATSALEAARGRYAAGVGTLADLLRAQSTLAQARVSLTEAKAARAGAVIELSYLTGELTQLIETTTHAN